MFPARGSVFAAEIGRDLAISNIAGNGDGPFSWGQHGQNVFDAGVLSLVLLAVEHAVLRPRLLKADCKWKVEVSVCGLSFQLPSFPSRSDLFLPLVQQPGPLLLLKVKNRDKGQ